MVNNICFLTPEEAVLVVHAHHTDYIASVCTNPANLPLHGFTGVMDFLGHIVEWDRGSEALIMEACSTVTTENWSFILTDGEIEQGLPHTIHHCIVLSRPALQRWSISSLRGTLLHERVHTLQKLHPERYDALYKTWGWKRMAASDVPLVVRERHRCNPDTPNWWYLPRGGGGKEKWIPYVRIRHGARSLMEVDYLYAVVAVSSDTKVHRYEKMGGDYRHMYHPEEIAAVLGYTT
jgi:hypothetical protein